MDDGGFSGRVRLRRDKAKDDRSDNEMILAEWENSNMGINRLVNQSDQPQGFWERIVR